MSESASEPTGAAAGCGARARCRSPNFGPRPEATQVDLASLHSISLPPGEYGGDAIERLFTNRLDWSAHPYFEAIRGLEVSAHFLIRRDGELLQFVSCDERAWHAGASRWQGRDNCNDFSIGIELEGLEGEPFDARSTPRPRHPARRARASAIRSPRSRATSTSRPAQARSRRRLRLARLRRLSPYGEAGFRSLIHSVAQRPFRRTERRPIGDNRFVTNLRVRRYR